MVRMVERREKTAGEKRMKGLEERRRMLACVKGSRQSRQTGADLT